MAAAGVRFQQLLCPTTVQSPLQACQLRRLASTPFPVVHKHRPARSTRLLLRPALQTRAKPLGSTERSGVLNIRAGFDLGPSEDPAVWSSAQLADFVAGKLGVSEIRSRILDASIDGSIIHKLKPSDIKKWGVDARLQSRTYSVIEGLVRSLPLQPFRRVRSTMTNEDFYEIVNESSAAVQELKYLQAEEFLKMKPQEVARFLGSEVLSIRLDNAMNEPKDIIVVRSENLRETVTVHGQEGLEKLLREAPHLILVDGAENQGRRVTKFVDLENGASYSFNERVSTYETLRRDLETLEQHDSERGINQAYQRLKDHLGATFLSANLMIDTAPRLRRGQVDKGKSTVVAVQGRPVPVAHRLHLRRWKQGKRTYPEIELDAIAPIGLRDGSRLILLGEGKSHAVEQDVEGLLSRVVIFEARLNAGDPQLCTPTGKVLDKGPYREYSIDLTAYADLDVLPVLFAGVYDEDVKTAASESGVVLLSWGGGAVDVIVPPQPPDLQDGKEANTVSEEAESSEDGAPTNIRGAHDYEDWVSDEEYEEGD